MQITINITEDSKVELVKDSCELVQGECCFTDFVFNFPETIKGYAIGEYKKYIEFAECKELGECVKFVDEIKGDKYELNEACTAFKKIMVQLSLERNLDGKLIIWKTVPFTLEFIESVNANADIEIRSQLLCLTEIRDKWQNDLRNTKDEWQNDLRNTKDEWQKFFTAHCFRFVYSLDDIPLANEESEDETIFYLGENSGDFEYGHYYHCVNIDGTCVWKDLTRDPSLEGVANGIREINKGRTMQLFSGTMDEILGRTHGENTIYIPEDADAETEIKELLETLTNKTSKIIPLYDKMGIPIISNETKPICTYDDFGEPIYACLTEGGQMLFGDSVDIELGEMVGDLSDDLVCIAIKSSSKPLLLDEKVCHCKEVATVSNGTFVGYGGDILLCSRYGHWYSSINGTAHAIRVKEDFYEYFNNNYQRKKKIFEGAFTVTPYYDTTEKLVLSENIYLGDVLEIHFSHGDVMQGVFNRMHDAIYVCKTGEGNTQYIGDAISLDRHPITAIFTSHSAVKVTNIYGGKEGVGYEENIPLLGVFDGLSHLHTTRELFFVFKDGNTDFISSPTEYTITKIYKL